MLSTYKYPAHRNDLDCEAHAALLGQVFPKSKRSFQRELPDTRPKTTGRSIQSGLELHRLVSPKRYFNIKILIINLYAYLCAYCVYTQAYIVIYIYIHTVIYAKISVYIHVVPFEIVQRRLELKYTHTHTHTKYMYTRGNFRSESYVSGSPPHGSYPIRTNRYRYNCTELG